MFDRFRAAKEDRGFWFGGPTKSGESAIKPALLQTARLFTVVTQMSATTPKVAQPRNE
jgi:hypothetical protein